MLDKGETEELVVTVYGSDTATSKPKIIAQTEVMGCVQEVEGGVKVFGLNELKLDKYEATRDLFVNRISVFSAALRKEITLPSHLPIKLRPGDTLTLDFKEVMSGVYGLA